MSNRARKTEWLVAGNVMLCLVACTGAGAPGDRGDDRAGGSGPDPGGAAGVHPSGGSGGEVPAGGAAGPTGGVGGEDGPGGAGGEPEAPPMGGGGGGVGGMPAQPGGSGGTPADGMAGAGGLPKFCSDPGWYRGSEPGSHDAAALAASAGTTPTALGPDGTIVKGNMADSFDEAWIPGQYQTTGSNTVGLLVLLGENPVRAMANFVRRLVHAGEIPPLIVAHAKGNFFSPNETENAAKVVQAIHANLKARYPKLSSDRKLNAVHGISTRGAMAFEIAWRANNLIGNAIAGSGSFVCFMPSYPYDQSIATGQNKAVRLSMVVGNCDIFGSAAQSMAAGCTVHTIDESKCKANWIDANKTVQAAMVKKGLPSQLIVVGTKESPRDHTTATWSALYDQLRFVYRPVTCTK